MLHAGGIESETGWGHVDRSWNAIENASKLGLAELDWFKLGDKVILTSNGRGG
ncbi:MAG: hypothetical protein U0V48_12210 [Anaerolineales bacterium]